MATVGDVGVYHYGLEHGDLVNKEDLLDLIVNISPWDTPFVAQAPKVRASAVRHDWLNDTLVAASTAGAIEGDDWSLSTISTPTRSSNYCMILRKDIAVTETQRAVNSAGFRDAYAYEVAKGMREVARNLEKIIFSNATSSTGATANTARVMKTLQTLINSASNATALGASATLLTETLFNDALENAYTNGGNPELCFASPAVKRTISQFTSNSQTRNVSAAEKKLINAVDLYDSDYGLVQIILDRWVPQSTNTSTATASAGDTSGNLFFLERAKNRVAWLRPFQHSLVGKRGDSVAGLIVGEMTLECLAADSNYRYSAVNNKRT